MSCSHPHPFFSKEVHRSWIFSPPSFPPTYTIIYVRTAAKIAHPLYTTSNTLFIIYKEKKHVDS